MTTSRRVELETYENVWDALRQDAELAESVVKKYQVTDSVAGTVPTNYEPRYAYPLVVWLCDSDCDQEHALDHIASMSPQNYLGLALDDTPDSKAQGLDRAVEFFQQLVELENNIVDAVREFRELVNVHTERIFLAGYGRAATTALTILGHQPSWFAGCACFSGSYPKANELLGNRSLTGKRVLLNAPPGQINWQAEQDTQHAARMLIASGADVTTKYQATSVSRFGNLNAEPRVSDKALRDFDEWIVSSLFVR
jgi:poly(3-hydroxybutyrate) depolymerase